MDACLDTFTTELYRLRGFATSPSFSPSLEAFKDEDADDGTGDDDEDVDASSSSDDEMTSQ